MTDLIICTHSREGKTPSYSRINTVVRGCSGCSFELSVLMTIDMSVD